MEDIVDYKEEVYKCSKCGLCKSVCPVFFAAKNEMFLPRGRYIILNRFFKTKEKLSKNFIKNLDICLNCNKCKDFCPSNIDSYKIFTELKSKYKKFNLFSFSSLFFIFMNLIRIPAKVFRILYLPKSAIINNLFKLNIKSANQTKDLTKKVVYFEGCVNKYINSSDKNASVNLIEKNGYKIEKIISLCCGYPYLSDGNIKKFTENAKKILNTIPSDCEYIVLSCDTCLDTLKRISLYIPNIECFENKLITLDKFLERNRFNFNLDTTNILYHKPLTRHCELDSGCKFININKKENASLMENFLLIRNINKTLKNKMINNIFYDKEQVEGKTIVTTCQLAKLGLIIGFYIKKIKAKVYTYAEFIELSENNKKKLTNNL